MPLFFNVPLRIWTFMASALETLKTEFMPLESCRVWTMTVIEKLQLTSYIVSFVLSFFHFVPVSLSQEYFGGRCILFTTGRWFVNTSNENPPTLTVSSWGRPSLCHYNIFIGMCSMILTFAQVVRLARSIHRRGQSTVLNCFVDFSICVLNVILFLVAAMILSFGFQEFCSVVSQAPSPITECREIDDLRFSIPYQGFSMAGFRNVMDLCQFGVWGSWSMWVVNFCLALLKLHHVHASTSDGEPLAATLSRETEKLVVTVQAVRNLWPGVYKRIYYVNFFIAQTFVLICHSSQRSHV